MKTVSFSIEKIYPTMTAVLDSGGEFKMIATGTSMLPLLRNGKDTIVLIKHPSKLKKYDVPLYRRSDGNFVLHRIVGIKKDGYVLCGDHQFAKEYGVKHSDIVAVLKGFYREGKYTDCEDFSYKCYCVFWSFTRGIRYIYKRIKGRIRRILKNRKK